MITTKEENNRTLQKALSLCENKDEWQELYRVAGVKYELYERAQSESSIDENVAVTGLCESQAKNKEIPSQGPSFNIILGAASYEYGIINPGVDMGRFLGEHGDPVNIHLGTIDEHFFALTIDRNQNPNGSVRINGGVRVVRWFQEHFHFGDSVIAKVLDCKNIVLLAPHVG